MPIYYPGHPLDSTKGLYGQTTESTIEYKDSILLEYATNGSSRSRGLNTNLIRSISIVHILDISKKINLLNFYFTNKSNIIRVLYEPTNEDISKMRFTSAPEVKILGDGICWCRTNLIEII